MVHNYFFNKHGFFFLEQSNHRENYNPAQTMATIIHRRQTESRHKSEMPNLFF